MPKHANAILTGLILTISNSLMAGPAKTDTDTESGALASGKIRYLRSADPIEDELARHEEKKAGQPTASRTLDTPAKRATTENALEKIKSSPARVSDIAETVKALPQPLTRAPTATVQWQPRISKAEEESLKRYNRKRNYCYYQVPGGGFMDLRTVEEVHRTWIGPKYKLMLFLKNESIPFEIPGTEHQTRMRERLILQYLDKCEAAEEAKHKR